MGLDYTLQAEQLNLHARPQRPGTAAADNADTATAAGGRGGKDKLHATRTQKAPRFVRADPGRSTGSSSSGAATSTLFWTMLRGCIGSILPSPTCRVMGSA